MSEKYVTGPIQVFVIGFEELDAADRILAELRRVRRRGVIRLVDLLVVHKNQEGDVTSAMQLTDLSEDERMRLGALAGGLLGLEVGGLEGAVTGADLGALAVAAHDYGLGAEELSDLSAVIPPGSAAAILVIEHHWAADLSEAIAEAGGVLLLQAMLTPEALTGMGGALDAALAAEEVIEAAEAVKLAAAVDAVQALADERLLEEAVLLEAAEVVAATLALADATATQVAAALIEADLVEAAVMDDVAEIVLETMAQEEPEPAEAAVR